MLVSRVPHFSSTSALVFLSFLAAVNASTSGFDSVKCADRARSLALSNSSTSVFLVRPDGSLTSNISEAWGITYPACLDLCGTGQAPFDWVFFTTSIGSWVLPWLALAAQLPYETKDRWGNFMSFFLAVGSPMLVTYSLTITVLNCRWINGHFLSLRNRDASLHPRLRGRTSRTLKNVCFFLNQSQCVPIEIVHGPQNEFAQLVVNPERRQWWANAAAALRKTRREWTTSLRFQIAFVALAQLLAVANFFATPGTSKLNIGGLGVGINSIWSWMIPICLGWVYVGSQTSHTGVRDALGQASHSTEQPFIGIRDRIGDDKRMRIHNGESFEMQPLGAHTFPRRLGIEGDAIEPGPIHNYARLWTHMNVAQAFVMAFQHMMTRLEDNRNPLISIKGEPWAYEDYEANLIGSARQMMEFIDVKRDIEDVTLICESPPHVAERVALATLVSLFVQWGTTGSAIVVAYFTPVVGLGCLSGPYIIYGVSATIVWFLLVLSSWLSQSYHSSSRPRFIRRSLALLFNRTGKFLAFLSALGIISFSCLQFTNVFDNCWCNSCAVSKGSGVKAYVTLFAAADTLTDLAMPAWKAGVAWDVLTVAFMLAFLGLGKGSLKPIGQ